MRRIDAIKCVIEELDNELIICNLGLPCQETYHLKDSPALFYMLGSIGLASSIGLGLAKSTDRKVVVLDGDGSLLYNLGSLVSVAGARPTNMYWVVLDNEAHGSTGFQRTYDSSVTNLAGLARAAGFSKVITARNVHEIKTAMKSFSEPGPVFLLIKIEKGNAAVDPIPMEPVAIKSRFMEEARRIEV